MSRGKLTVRVAVIAFGLLVLAGAFLVSREGSDSGDGTPAGAGVPTWTTGATGDTGGTAPGR